MSVEFPQDAAAEQELLADVAAVRAGAEAAQQVECEGVVVHFAAGGEEFGVIEQRGAGFVGERVARGDEAEDCGDLKFEI